MVSGAPVSVRCPGKLNLFLEVLARRPDGYHEIESVMVPAPMEDRIEATLAADGRVELDVRFLPGGELPGIPAGDANLAARAARAVLEEVRSGVGVRLVLWKSIPAGAGLGGGSSDAAGALKAVNRLLGESISPERLRELALALGSDVPYFLEGGAALGRGRGERLEPVPYPGNVRFLVLVPDAPCSTAEVYGRCAPAASGDRRDPGPVLRALASGDPEALSRSCFNRLAEPAAAACPAVGEALAALRSLGAGEPHVTGSGSACFLVLSRGADGEALMRRLPETTGGRTVVCG